MGLSNGVNSLTIGLVIAIFSNYATKMYSEGKVREENEQFDYYQ
jgi:hypothetical protein